MRAETLAHSNWIRGVHNYLRDLLTDDPRAGWRRRYGYRVKPEGLHDIAIVRPSIQMIGWSCAPQVAGRGKAHVLKGIAYGTYRYQRVGYAEWVCGGHSTYPVQGDPKPYQERCTKCFLLSGSNARVETHVEAQGGSSGTENS